MQFPRFAFFILSSLALSGSFSVAHANYINLDLSYVDMQSAAYQRFKNYVDEAVAGNPDYGFGAGDAAYMFALTGGAQYCTLAVQMAEQQVSDAEAAIAAGGAPDIVHDSYLYAGGELMDLSLAYDWCSAYVSSSQRTRWAAYANQTLFNIWNPTEASWGGNPFPWSGWAIDDPGNNYYYSFIDATMYWALASNSQAQWIPFLANVKLPVAESYFATLPGGGSEEGTSYGTSHRWLFGAYRLWRDVTGVDLGNASSHMTDTISYWAHATVPTMDRFAPIGDQSRASIPWLYDYHRHVVLEARMETTNQAAKDIASWWLHSISIDHMTNGFNYRHDLLPAGGSGEPAPSELSYYAPGAGVLFARTSWTPSATWLAFIAGQYTESHAHQEQGAFTLFGGGDWMTVTENIWSNSGIHSDTSVSNIVRFEHDGAIIPQNSPTDSDMAVTQGEDGNVHAVADLTPAYDGDPNIGSWQRSIDFTSGLLTVTDNFSVSSGTQATFQINVPNRPTVSGATAIAGSMQVTVLQPADATLSVVDWTSVDGDFLSGYRIDVRGSGNQFVVQFDHTDKILVSGFD